jgi:putative peptidoglycan lipid II flippase
VLSLTTRLIQFILPSVACFGVSAVLTGLLYSQQRFTFPAFGAAIYNLGIILGGLLLARHFGVTGLAVGVVLGAVLQMVIQLPGLRGLGLRPALELDHPGLRRILALYTPVVLGLVVSQIAVVIDRNLASRTGEGSMAAMRFATTLIQFPLGLVVTAISMAVLPTLSRLASDKDLAEFRRTLALGVRMVLILIIPATVGLAVLSRPIVALLFERGAFSPEDTSLTVLALTFYLIGLPCAAVDQPLIYAFYARKDTRTPVLVGVMAIGVYLVVAVALIRPLGMVGLVLANSAQWASHALVMLVLLHRRLDGVRGQGLGLAAGRTLLASLAMALVTWLAQGWLGGAFPGGGALNNLIVVAGAGLAGGAVYLAAATALGVSELRVIGELVWSRLQFATEAHGRTQK